MSDIQSLFDKDPLNLTLDDLDALIAYYREKRAQFNIGDTQAGSTKRMKKTNSTEVKVNIDDILKGM